MATRPKTLKSLEPWTNWSEHLEATQADAQRCEGRYTYITFAGRIDSSASCDAGPADESEVRSTMKACSHLVNPISEECGYNMQLAGNGNNRGLSDTDWLVRDRLIDPGNIATARATAAAVQAPPCNRQDAPDSAPVSAPVSAPQQSPRISSSSSRRAALLAGNPDSTRAATTPCDDSENRSTRQHGCIEVKPNGRPA